MILVYSSVILVEGGEKCSSFQPKPRDGVIPLQANPARGAPRGWLVELGILIGRGRRQLTPRWAFADLQYSLLSEQTAAQRRCAQGSLAWVLWSIMCKKHRNRCLLPPRPL